MGYKLIGPDNPRWNGGVRILKNGYRMILDISSPSAGKDGYVCEHRSIFEQTHKCCLLPWADVHHINGIRGDNRPENLRAMMNSQHSLLHSNTAHKLEPFKWTEEFRIKSRERMLGNTIMKGRKHSEETKRKIALSVKAYRQSQNKPD